MAELQKDLLVKKEEMQELQENLAKAVGFKLTTLVYV